MDTPRTDAEHAKTLTPAYEYEGAEQEAWEWARKLEKELIEAIGEDSVAIEERAINDYIRRRVARKVSDATRHLEAT